MIEELDRDPIEPEIRLEERGRRLLRWRQSHRRQTESSEFVLDSDGSYLVTGGFGGLGRELLRWLAGHGARHLVVVSRSATSSNSRSLIEDLEAAGVPLDTPVAGIPKDSAFFRWIMEGDTETPIEAIRDDAVAAARSLVRDHPSVGAIVSECTNLTPFAADIQAATGLPVYDMVSMVTWFQMGLRPRRFDG